VIFTTIQKFSRAAGEIAYPVLSNRRDIVVIVDEAHRRQYGFQAGRSSHSGKTCSSLDGLSSGFASHEAAVSDADVMDETSRAEKMIFSF
jgi:type I site-specific restriction-modification system R (restriction) subunit